MSCCGTNPFAPDCGAGQGCDSCAPSPCAPPCVFCGPTGQTGPPALGASYAFTVAYNGLTTVNVPTTGVPVLYNQVVDGAVPPLSFNPFAGSFQVPETGLYLISPTVSVDFAGGSAVSKVMIARIFVNGQSVSSFYLAASIVVPLVTARYGTASWSLIWSLRANDTIQIIASTNAGTIPLVAGLLPAYATTLSILSLF